VSGSGVSVHAEYVSRPTSFLIIASIGQEGEMGFFSKLFSLNNKPPELAVALQMERLADASRMATAMMLMHELGMPQADNESEQMQIATRAGLQASLIFDKPLAPEHELLDIEAERKKVLEWLEDRPLFKELVVQTLRVDNIVRFAKTGQPPNPLIGASLLGNFGKQFRNGPSPDSYNSLLSDVIHSMPAQIQAKMVAWLQQNRDW
jgi:hypothetical protein